MFKKVVTSFIFTIIFLSFWKPAALCIEGIDIHGFASTGYIKSEKYDFVFATEKGSFEFSEYAFNLHTQMNDSTHIALQFFSYNMGELGNNNAYLDWAFLDYKWIDALGIRVGKFKTPFGLYNQIQDYDMLRTPIFLPQGIYTLYYRDLIIATQGMNVYGMFNMNAWGKIGYDIYGGTYEVPEESPYTNLSSHILDSTFVNAEVEYMFGGRLKYFTPVKGLLLSMSAEYYDVTFNYLYKHVLPISIEVPRGIPMIYSIEYNHGPLTFAAEYLRHVMKTDLPTALSPYARIDWDAFYIMLSYRFSEWFEAGANYSSSYWDRDNHQGRGFVHDYQAWQKDMTLSARFDITYFWLLKMEIHFINGTALAFPPEDKDFEGENWVMYAIKTTFSF